VDTGSRRAGSLIRGPAMVGARTRCGVARLPRAPRRWRGKGRTGARARERVAVDGLPQGPGQPPVALLAGLLCGFGNGFQFMGGQAVGYAAADPVQALPLVNTFWGILLFGEYCKSSWKTYILLGFMLFMFVAVVAVLMASSGHRST
jgi:hypothetical protein